MACQGCTHKNNELMKQSYGLSRLYPQKNELMKQSYGLSRLYPQKNELMKQSYGLPRLYPQKWIDETKLWLIKAVPTKMNWWNKVMA
jgi:hypothetical protein